MRRFGLTRTLSFLFAYFVVYSQTFAQVQSVSGEVQQALDYEKQGAFLSAEESWKQITIASPQNADAWAHLGLVRALEGKYPDAVAAYRKAGELHSQLPGLQIDLGLALFKQQKFKDAIPALQAAVEESPKDVKPKLLLAMSYYGSAQYAEAIPYLKFAVSSSPDNLQLRMTLAQSCLWAEQYSCTLEQYQEILRLNPQSAQADMLAGEASDGLNQTVEAIKLFQEAEKVSPHEPEVHFGLGYLLWKEHRFEEAETEFKLELEDNPNQAQALTYLGDIAIRHNDEDTALNYLQRAVAQPQAIRLAYLDLGIVDADHKRNEDALVNFQRAIDMDPAQVDAHYRLGRLYVSMGKPKEAQAEFAKTNDLQRKVRETLAQKMAPVTSK
jgi:tetratricopeptide (TPR) repeat protein